MTYMEDLSLRLTAVEYLRILKCHYTSKELQSKTGVSITQLSRYAKGHVLPSLERAKKLITQFRGEIAMLTQDYLEDGEVINPVKLKFYVQRLALALAGSRVTKILIDKTSTRHIGLGVALSLELQTPLVIAEPLLTLKNGEIYFTTKKKVIKKNDSVIIVGAKNHIESLKRIVEHGRAEVVKIIDS